MTVTLFFFCQMSGLSDWLKELAGKRESERARAGDEGLFSCTAVSKDLSDLGRELKGLERRSKLTRGMDHKFVFRLAAVGAWGSMLVFGISGMIDLCFIRVVW